MLPQIPSDPPPFFAAVHATQVPLHAALQQTPSAQWPLPQSVSFAHCLPCPHRVAQPPPPPQSTSVSVPSFAPVLQFSVDEQASGSVPQVAPS
jgi:hypothetical protein